MPVTKRTRYEVLKRDNHTCRYCHATDTPLTIDHVTPTALGGTDEPNNLVAACRDCNSGKASTSPNAELVEDVREDALRHAELVRQAYEVLVERMGERDDYIEEFATAYTYQPLPDEWRNSIGRWFEMGVPIEILTDAADIACSKPEGQFRGSDRFRYMCGIVWNQVRTIDELAEKYRSIEGRFFSEEELTNKGIDDYMTGQRYAYRRMRSELTRADPLSIVVDRIDYPADAWEVA